MTDVTSKAEEMLKGLGVSAEDTTDIEVADPVSLDAVAPSDAPIDEEPSAEDLVFDASELSVFYGDFRAVRDVNMKVRRNEITALIGPSGCGKSTVLRSFNRMNDLIPTARVVGNLLYRGVDLYDARVDPVEVRRRIGMVFQKPNPFPKSIYDNVAYGCLLYTSDAADE